MGVFKKVIITQEKENCFFLIHNPVGANLLTRLRLRLRHLMNINLEMVLKIQLFLYVYAIRKSNVTIISSCVAIFILLKD